jgi:hypothetical protein
MQVEGSNGSQYLYTHEIGEYEPHYRQLQIIHAFIQKEYRIRRKNIFKNYLKDVSLAQEKTKCNFGICGCGG